jgi:oligopeptidase A
MNPHLDFSALPLFRRHSARTRHPGCGPVAAENRALVERVATAAEAPTWDSFVALLDDANERLSRAWGQVAHLNAVMNNLALRETQCQPAQGQPVLH